jgi:hypothetical protein
MKGSNSSRKTMITSKEEPLKKSLLMAKKYSDISKDEDDPTLAVTKSTENDSSLKWIVARSANAKHAITTRLLCLVNLLFKIL